jgi:D,D-heptose 1,7-bisphosphate phosphatase
MVTTAVILAGGKGTRLSAVAQDIPKALVAVGGKPLLQHQIELLAIQGFHDIRIFGGHLADKIRDFTGDGSRFGVQIQFEIETQPLGSAGAVLEKLNTLPEDFLVIYGDIMMAVDLAKMVERHVDLSADLTAFVHPNDHPYDSDLMEVDANDWITKLHPSPHPEGRFFGNLVNAALYVIRRDALAEWAGDAIKRDFAKDVVPALLNRGGSILSHRTTEYIKDMGTPDRLVKVEKDLMAGRIQLHCQPEPAVFLDRDGTLNAENGFIRSPEQLSLQPGVADALRRLRSAGFRLVLLTNQPVIARGEATEVELAEIHQKLEWELGLQGAYLDAIYYCPHHPDGGFAGERPELKGPCDCRKPGTAMLERACRELSLDPQKSWMIGDTTTDMELARRGGLQSILVATGEGGRDGKYPEGKANHRAADLAAAADVVLHDLSTEIPST